MLSSTVMEYLALIAEIETLKEEVELLRAPVKSKKPERVLCQSVTGKGVPCKRYSVDGCLTCKVHGKPQKEVKPKKPPRVPKIVCTGLNMRGNPCKNKCVENQTWCEKHDPSLPPKEKKSKKKKNMKFPEQM